VDMLYPLEHLIEALRPMEGTGDFKDVRCALPSDSKPKVLNQKSSMQV
jgi:hypothetical protein